MGSLRPDLTAAYERLQAALKELLSEQTPSISIKNTGAYPLLIVTLKTELVGFAIANTSAKESVERAYEEFQHLYKEQHQQWARLNLSFVVLRESSTPGLDAFFNEFEIDTFFCRKYVLRLDADLKSELLRLHFIPLEHDSVFTPARPVSAQGLLSQLGISADIARDLVLPHRRGDESFVDAALKGELGKPILLHRASPMKKGRDELRSDEPMRLRSIVLEDFRSYKGRHHFDLDADIVVLYGPNGLGKTSLFDAIDFACTGGSGRLKPRGDAEFRQAVRHLDAALTSGQVTIEASVNGSPKKITRKLENPSKASMSGQPLDRFQTLLELTGNKSDDIEKRVDSLIDLFRATHLFGQDYQNLAPDFQRDCRLSLDIVSRMLAFQDYVRGIQKTRAIAGRFDHRGRELERQISEVRERLGELKSRIGQLSTQRTPTPSSAHKDLADIKEHFEKLLRIKLPKPSGEDESRILARWKSTTESALGESREQLRRIRAIQEGWPDYQAKLKGILKNSQEHATAEKQAKVLQDSQRNLEENIGNLKKRIASSKTDRERAEEELKNARWQLKALSDLATLSESLEKESARHKDLKGKKTARQKVLEDLRSKADAIQNEMEKLKEAQSVAEDNRDQHSQLLKKSRAWESNARLLSKNQLQLKELAERKGRAGSAREKAEQELAERQKALQNIDAELEQTKESGADLARILDALEKHIDGSLCPTCGHEHGSKSALLKKLQAQRVKHSPQIQRLAASSETIREQTVKLKAQIEKAHQQAQEIDRTSDELGDTVRALEQENGEIAQFAKGMRLSLEGGVKAIQDRIAHADQQISAHKQSLARNASEKEALSQKIEGASAALESIEEEAAAAEERKDEIQLKIEQLKGEAKNRKISLSAGEDDAKKRAASLSEQLGILKAAQAQESAKLTALESSDKTANREVAANETLVRQLEKHAAILHDSVDQFRSELLALDIKGEATPDDVALKRGDTAERIRHLDKLELEINSAEANLAALHKMAEATQLESLISSEEKALIDLKQKRALHQDWGKHFAALSTELQRLRDGSVQEYTRIYGPLASVIQRRLRAVYGFGPIELSAVGGEIDVRIERAEQKLKPTDYFSESQKQILILSLFLTAAMTQNWSRFAPILMDDPVMHFDDLNAYSFLDLIAGLTSNGGMQRQFIISTCEERLFQLMRQKFMALGCSLAIYQFQSIGESGPVVSRVHAPTSRG